MVNYISLSTKTHIPPWVLEPSASITKKKGVSTPYFQEEKGIN